MRNLVWVTLILFSSFVYASDDGVVNDPLDWNVPPGAQLKSMHFPRLRLAPSEIYSRTQAVMKHFQVPDEASNLEALGPYQSLTTAEDMKGVLKILDASGELKRFVKIDSDEMYIFSDRDGYAHEDATYVFSKNTESTFISPALLNLSAARNNLPAEALKNLKIALDPGHMNSGDWESRTGKFVKDLAGHRVSESVINLQTALVLKEELEKLGAIVLVTREGAAPVSTIPREELNLTDYGRLALRERAFESWFQDLLNTAPAGTSLFNAFEKSSKVQALFKESARDNYFILRNDLDARVEKIDDFQPDISLVIHYDAATSGVNPISYSRVKTYVHGSLGSEEWATQEDRRHVLLHALDPVSSKSSFDLARSVVNSLSKNLGLPTDSGGGGNSTLVAPGVFSRNLFITRKMHNHAHTYVECLHYNDPSEFKAFLQKDFPLVIDGETTYYSRRLRDVAFAIRDGVVNFVRGSDL
ncbi:MAG: N-acetylmuramoyl-L-alanine amidase [Bacteriovoracaceae bacterium]